MISLLQTMTLPPVATRVLINEAPWRESARDTTALQSPPFATRQVSKGCALRRSATRQRLSAIVAQKGVTGSPTCTISRKTTNRHGTRFCCAHAGIAPVRRQIAPRQLPTALGRRTTGATPPSAELKQPASTHSSQTS